MTPGNVASTPRPLNPHWSTEATPFPGNYVTILLPVIQKPDVPPVYPKPKRFTFDPKLIQAQAYKPSFCNVHGIPAAGEETGGASSAFTKPAHPQQEAPAQHVSAAIGERSGQSATMENFCADKFPSLDSENDGNFRP